MEDYQRERTFLALQVYAHCESPTDVTKLQVPLWFTSVIPEEEEDDPEIIDVTDALQLLVNNSYVTLFGFNNYSPGNCRSVQHRNR